MFKKILAPFDFSTPSLQALSWAVKIGEYFESRLKVLHVVSGAEILPEKPFLELQGRLIPALRAELDRLLSELQDPQSDRSLTSLEVDLPAGKPFKEILAEVEAWQADLVVMGPVGQTGLSQALLGSVAEKVARHAPVPVLIAKEPSSWPPKRVLLPVDLFHPIEETLQFAKNFLQGLPCQTELLYVMPVSDLTGIPLEGGTSINLYRGTPLEGEMNDKMKNLAASLDIPNLQTNLSEGRAPEEIVKRARESKCDLILIPTHGLVGAAHFFMGSVAEQVLRYAPCSVLTYSPPKIAGHRRAWLQDIQQKSASEPSGRG